MTKSHLAVLDRRLGDGTWIMGDDFGIADISTFPWVSNLIGFYNAGDLVGIAEFTHVLRALNSFKQRPAVIRGSDIPKRSAVPS
jgi:GSH-dependent disulfide-bond oxidoreductase